MDKNGNYFSNHLVIKKLDKCTNKRSYASIQRILSQKNSSFLFVSEFKIGTYKNRVFYQNCNKLNYDNIDFEKLIFLGKIDKKYFFTSLDNSSIIKQINGPIFYENFRTVSPALPSDRSSLLAYGMQLAHWHCNNIYCGKCGKKTKTVAYGLSRVCTNNKCELQIFPKISPAIIVLVKNKNKVLLAHQPRWPQNMYSTLAGFMEPAERIEDTVKREVFEETSINVDDITYFDSQPWPFPDSLMIGFFATTNDLNIRLLDNELDSAKWFTKKDIEQGLTNGKLKMPTKISIAYRLIEKWFDEDNHHKLSNLVMS